jgi:glycerol uptake facilitator-like aquaporin
MNRGVKSVVAEFAGTFVVVVCSAGAICTDQFLRSHNHASLGLGGIALAYGLAVAVTEAFFGPAYVASSPAGTVRVADEPRGHFNPAVALAFWATRRLNTFALLAYWVAQLAGATAAGYLLRFVVPQEVWRAAALGTPELRDGMTRAPAMLIEGATTFFLVLIVFTGYVGRAVRFSTAMVTGVAVTAGVFISLPFTGGSMNPARAFGPALASRHWTNQGVYWVGPLCGAIAAAWVYEAARFSHRATQPRAADVKDVY